MDNFRLPHSVCKALTIEFKNLNIKLYDMCKSYSHTISTNYIRIIPKGIRGFIWFKLHNNKPYCYFIKNGFKECYSFNCSFDHFLCNNKIGTIIGGTIVTIKNVRFFVSDTIFYHQGEFIKQLDDNNKLLNDIIKYRTKQLFMTNNDICMMNSIYLQYKDLVKSDLVNNLLYDIYLYKIYNKNKNKTYTVNVKNIKLHKETTIDKSEKIFTMKALIDDDIYMLYDDNEKEIGYADVSNYKTSIMLNTIFRTIKENNNLDFIEESDDEDDFENINDDKYVDLNKCVKFKCIYNQKFNLWKPIEQK